MTPEQVEEKVIELIHREPFVPFVVEFVDGQSVVVPHARVSVNTGCGGFIGLDGGLVDLEFTGVRAIRPITFEAIV